MTPATLIQKFVSMRLRDPNFVISQSHWVCFELMIRRGYKIATDDFLLKTLRSGFNFWNSIDVVIIISSEV